MPKRGAEVGGILIGTITGSRRRRQYRPDRGFRAGSLHLCPRALLPFDRMPSGRYSTKCASAAVRKSSAITAVTLARGSLCSRKTSSCWTGIFTSPAQVALLVKPFATKPGVAGFFVRENGVFPAATPLEFPFRRWEMTGEEPPRRPPMQERKPEGAEEPAQALPNPREEAPASEPSPQAVRSYFFR